MEVKINKNDHVIGVENAPIELIEYADYQCPYCGEAYSIIKIIQKKMGDKLKFVFRNFPIQELHPYAVHAAITAEVAGSHGKFWEMHDLLFENQHALTDADLIRYAEKVGIDAPQFKKDFENEAFLKKVKSDFDSGIENGIEGTPAFFINGKIYEGDWTSPYFLNYLQSISKKHENENIFEYK